jgi:hypothetical protein
MTRRQEAYQKRHQLIYNDYAATDEHGRPKMTLAQLRAKYGLRSNEGIYYAIDKIEGRRRKKHGQEAKTRKDLTNN